MTIEVPTTSGATEPFVIAAGEVRGGPLTRPWGTRVRGADTGGLVAIGEADMPPLSAGPPLHVHSREDEAALVLEGVLTVHLGTQRIEVREGGIAWLPRGVPHTFANLTSTRVRAIGLILPGGLDEMFAERDAYLRTHGTPDVAWLEDQNARYGLTTLGPPIEVPASR